MGKIQVLIATMHQHDCKNLIKKMNIHSDTIVINQCDTYGYDAFDFNGNQVEVYSVQDRGLSRSRNTALIKSSSEFLCIADDDMIYSNTYVEDIIHEFDKHKDADAIVFYVKPVNGQEHNISIKRSGRLGKLEYKEFSSVEIVVRRDKLLASNIWFNATFGSGGVYNCGEDTILLKDMLNKGFRIYKSDIQIATVDMSESTWFDGYNEKYFYNKGALVAAIYPHLWPLAIIVLSLKNSVKKLGGINKAKELFLWYRAGALDYKRRVR